MRVRSLLVGPYRLYYAIDDDVVTIAAIFHTRRDIAALLEQRGGR